MAPGGWVLTCQRTGGVVDAHYGSGVSFRDPDGIPLEFYLPAGRDGHGAGELRADGRPELRATRAPDGGEPLSLFESGAILVYLAEKTGRLMSSDAARRYPPTARVIIHGAARGADSLAEELAYELGFQVIACPADWLWPSHCSSSGKLTNSPCLTKFSA